MKRIYKYLFVFLGSLFIFPLVSSAECSYERQAELSKIAANVKFSYTYVVSNGLPVFNVIITNLTNDIYVKDDSMNTFSGSGEKTATYQNGTSVSYSIYSNDNTCKGERILTKYINLPTYNNYSSSEECRTNSDFKYCQVWDATGVNVDDFNQQYANYTMQLNKKNQETTQQDNVVQMIKQFINNNLTIIIACLVAISILIMMFIYKKVRK